MARRFDLVWRGTDEELVDALAILEVALERAGGEVDDVYDELGFEPDDVRRFELAEMLVEKLSLVAEPLSTPDALGEWPTEHDALLGVTERQIEGEPVEVLWTPRGGLALATVGGESTHEGNAGRAL